MNSVETLLKKAGFRTSLAEKTPEPQKLTAMQTIKALEAARGFVESLLLLVDHEQSKRTLLPEGVEVTQLKRADGGVDMVRARSGKWLVRSVYGPTWFWCPEIDDWLISIGLDVEEMDRRCGLSYEQALQALQTVEKKGSEA